MSEDNDKPLTLSPETIRELARQQAREQENFRRIRETMRRLSNPTENPTEPTPKQRAQEQNILAEIKSAGYDPLALPPTPPGKSGVKKEIRDKLDYSAKVFDKAWERLRKHKDIASRPSP